MAAVARNKVATADATIAPLVRLFIRLLPFPLATRLVSIPMMINMAVAIITVKMKDVSGIDDFVELDEPLYALAYFWLFISGAGWISVDHLIRAVHAGPVIVRQIGKP
jgi:uncharacterized membrane protein YphA (DoxX/SURF4 family)